MVMLSIMSRAFAVTFVVQVSLEVVKLLVRGVLGTLSSKPVFSMRGRSLWQQLALATAPKPVNCVGRLWQQSKLNIVANNLLSMYLQSGPYNNNIVAEFDRKTNKQKKKTLNYFLEEHNRQENRTLNNNRKTFLSKISSWHQQHQKSMAHSKVYVD